MNLSLVELYKKHQGYVSDKWDLYLDVYDRVLLPYRERKVNLFEIGVQNGGSLEIWDKFFINANQLIGCDINESCAKLNHENKKISLFIGDANHDSTVARIASRVKDFDIVIDDGSHTSGDIIKSFLNYFPLVKDEGLYIIEDLHCSYWSLYQGGLYDPLSSLSFFKRLIDVQNFQHWGVDIRREEYLADFENKYGISFTEELLNGVHSIEFINSMCIIRKSEFKNNFLRKRIVAGSVALVVPSIKSADGSGPINPDERKNVYSRPLGENSLISKMLDKIKHYILGK